MPGGKLHKKGDCLADNALDKAQRFLRVFFLSFSDNIHEEAGKHMRKK